MNQISITLSSEARVPTEAASRYLQQLCKHFQHKLPAGFDERDGRVEFPAGRCKLDATAEARILLMHVTASDEAALARLEDVVVRHLAVAPLPVHDAAMALPLGRAAAEHGTLDRRLRSQHPPRSDDPRGIRDSSCATIAQRHQENGIP